VSGTTTHLKPIWVEVKAPLPLAHGGDAQLMRDTLVVVRDAINEADATTQYEAPVDAIRLVAGSDAVAVFELDVLGPNHLPNTRSAPRCRRGAVCATATRSRTRW
jgi:hypothetical protein